MKNKGFTLVEIIGVITLIGVLALITIPITKNVISKSKEKSLNASKDHIVKVSKNYFTETGNLPTYDKSSTSVSVNELVDASYLESDVIVNPVTEKPLEGCVSVKYDASSKSYNYEFKDECVNQPAPPELENNLIPVYYDEDASSWKTVLEDGFWYDYDSKQYANAVIVNSPKKYKNLKTSVEIPDSEIVSIFVWIPRFEYSYNEDITSIDTSTNVKFIKKTQIKADKGYHIHPGFTYKGKNINGFWISKFQTSGTTSNRVANPNAEVNASTNIGTLYSSILTFSNNYKIADQVRMQKATEFLAALDLAQSQYGVYENKISDDDFLLTALDTTIKNGGGNYRTNTAFSSTNNVTGVYDILSIRYEYVLFNINNTVTNESGFNGKTSSGSIITGNVDFPQDYEIDVVKIGDFNKACNNSSCLGYFLKNMFKTLSSNNGSTLNSSPPFYAYGSVAYSYGIKFFGVQANNGGIVNNYKTVTRMTLVVE